MNYNALVVVGERLWFETGKTTLFYELRGCFITSTATASHCICITMHIYFWKLSSYHYYGVTDDVSVVCCGAPWRGVGIWYAIDDVVDYDDDDDDWLNWADDAHAPSTLTCVLMLYYFLSLGEWQLWNIWCMGFAW